MAARASALLAAMWAGVLLSIGAIGAPSAFAVLAAPDAGRVAGRMFAAEAQLGIAIAVVLLLLERRRSARFETPLFTLELGLLFGAIFCTVVGYFALQPLMAVAREGRGARGDVVRRTARRVGRHVCHQGSAGFGAGVAPDQGAKSCGD